MEAYHEPPTCCPLRLAVFSLPVLSGKWKVWIAFLRCGTVDEPLLNLPNCETAPFDSGVPQECEKPTPLRGSDSPTTTKAQRWRESGLA